MTCLGCNNIEVKPVTLVDGTVVCNTCEAWRHECEARMIAGMETLQQRREYLDIVERRRGKPAADALRVTMMLIWDQRKTRVGK